MDSTAQSSAISQRGHDESPALLPPKKVAAMLSVTVRTLEAWRYRGEGPAWLVVSARCVRYRRSDVEAWLDQRQRPT